MNYTPLPEGLASFNNHPVKGGGSHHAFSVAFRGLIVVVLTVAAGLSTATLIRNVVTLQNKAEEQTQVAICLQQGGAVWDGQQCPEGAQEVNKIVTQVTSVSKTESSASQNLDGTTNSNSEPPSNGDGSTTGGGSTSIGSTQMTTKVQLCCKLPSAPTTIPNDVTKAVEPTPAKTVPAPTEAERCELPGISTILSCPGGCVPTQ